MEKLAKKLAYKIAASLTYDNEKEAVIAYGLFAILQTTLTIVLVFLIGVLLDAPVEALITCLSASVLRKYSGGVHAVAAELCTSIGVVYCTLTAFISKKLLLSAYNPFAMAIVIFVIFCLAYIVIYRKAPVDSPNKPIKTEKKIKRMRKGSFISISIYFCFSIAMFLLSYKYDVFKSYGMSLLFGIGWQVLTLTEFGYYFTSKLNNLYAFLRKEV